jgi:hypothetical protein
MRKLVLVFLACALLAIVPSLAVDRVVNTASGTDTGDCTAACKTIGYAVSQAVSGEDVIRVFPGTYNECIDAESLALDFVADAIENGGAASDTVIDGTGVCGGKVCFRDAATSCLKDSECAEGICAIAEGETSGTCTNDAALSCNADGDCVNPCVTIGHCSLTTSTVCALFRDCPEGESCVQLEGTAPAIYLGANSSLKGFTVKGGGESGVYFNGTATIEKNVITRNGSSWAGGGVYGETWAFGGTDAARAVADPDRCWGDTGIECAETADCTVCEGDHTVPCAETADCAAAGGDCVSLGPCLAIAEAKLDGNAITDNVAVWGGGVLLDVEGIYGGGARVVITSNTITGNSAEASGGGVYAFNYGYGYGRADALVSGNTLADNMAGYYGGGIQAAGFSSWYGTTRVAITTNTIEGNSAEGDGGGVAGIVGYYGMWYTNGDDKLDVAGNIVTANNASYDGGGIAVQLERSAYYGILPTATISENTISGNSSGDDGGGIDTFLWSAYSFEYATPVENGIRVSKNTVTENTAEVDGGGISSYLVSYYAISNGVARVEQNTLQGNSAGLAGGGARLRTESIGIISKSPQAFRQPGGDYLTEHWFEHNLVVGNIAHNSDGNGVGGGAFVHLEGPYYGYATVGIDFSTFEANEADTGGGAVEVEADTGEATPGFAGLVLADTIAANNVGYALGGPVPGSAGTFVPASNGNLDIVPLYSDGYGNTFGNIERTLLDNIGLVGTCVDGTCDNDASLTCAADYDCNGGIETDPLLDASGVPSVCSPTIDTAAPSADYSLEPMPNGFRANMGHLGGTADAVQTLPDVNGDRQVSGADVVLVSNTFGAEAPVVREAGDTLYTSVLDINRDGIIDGDDLAYVAAFYGTDCR